MVGEVEYVNPEDIDKYVAQHTKTFVSEESVIKAAKKLALKNLPFEEKMTIESNSKDDVEVHDIEDDKERELALYVSF